jgi:hypothetical protein
MEYRKGCPACDHTDPELERELRALAQLLVDAYIEDCRVSLNQHPGRGIDNAGGQVRLKGVDNSHIADE